MIRFFLLFILFVSCSNYIFAQQDIDILNVPTAKPATGKQNKPKVTETPKSKRSDFKAKIEQTQKVLFVPNLPDKTEDSLILVIKLLQDSSARANDRILQLFEQSIEDKRSAIDIIKDKNNEIREKDLEVHKVKCDSSNFDNFFRLSFILTEKNRKRITFSNDLIRVKIKKQIKDADFTDKNIIHVSGKDYAQQPILYPQDIVKFDFVSQRNKEFETKNKRNYYVFFYTKFDKTIGSYTIDDIEKACLTHQELKDFTTFSSMNVANYDTNDITLRSKKVIFKAWDGDDKVADGDKITLILNDKLLVFKDTQLFSKDSPTTSELIELKEGLNTLTVIASSYGNNKGFINPFITVDDGYLHKQPVFKESGSWKEKTWTIFVKSFD